MPLTKKKSVVHSQIGPVIVDLIEELEIQLDQEFYSYYKTESPNHRQALPATAPVFPRGSKSSVPFEKPDRMTKSTSAGTVRTRACMKHSHLDQVGKSNESIVSFSFFFTYICMCRYI